MGPTKLNRAYGILALLVISQVAVANGQFWNIFGGSDAPKAPEGKWPIMRCKLFFGGEYNSRQKITQNAHEPYI